VYERWFNDVKHYDDTNEIKHHHRAMEAGETT